MTDTEARRIHTRIDEQARAVGEINASLKEIAATCVPCKQRIDHIGDIVEGNG